RDDRAARSRAVEALLRRPSRSPRPGAARGPPPPARLLRAAAPIGRRRLAPRRTPRLGGRHRPRARVDPLLDTGGEGGDCRRWGVRGGIGRRTSRRHARLRPRWTRADRHLALGARPAFYGAEVLVLGGTVVEVTAGLGFGAVVVVALRTVVDGAARAVAGVGLTVVVVVVGSVVVGGGRVVSGSVVGGAL